MAKVVGTVVSIGGATVITLYKGLPLFHHNLHVKSLVTLSSSSPILNWTLGCVFILGHCLSWSGWMVLQVDRLLPIRSASLFQSSVHESTEHTHKIAEFSALIFVNLCDMHVR